MLRELRRQADRLSVHARLVSQVLTPACGEADRPISQHSAQLSNAVRTLALVREQEHVAVQISLPDSDTFFLVHTAADNDPRLEEFVCGIPRRVSRVASHGDGGRANPENSDPPGDDAQVKKTRISLVAVQA